MKFAVYLFIFMFYFGCAREKIIPQKTTQKIIREKAVIHCLPDLPNQINFCGETIFLEDEDVKERLDKEVLINAYYQSSTLQALKRANRYFPTIEPILDKQGIPNDFKYLAVIESNLLQSQSPVGARGFWQFMPSTASEYNLIINNEIDERLNIEKSTTAACKYLKNAYNVLNNWCLAAASYNRGVEGVKNDMNWQKSNNYFDTYMNSETARYVYRILAMKLIFENPEAYGFNIKKIELYKPFRTISVDVKKSIPNLALWAIDKGINYKILLKLNPWLSNNSLTVVNVPYKIILPRKEFNLKPYQKYTLEGR